MARDHGRVLVQIWNDPEWIRLSQAAQRAYILALSQPDLSYAGVLATRYKRWSGFASDSSVPKIKRAIRELEDSHFVMVDDGTEEMWIRTFVKHDGILNYPNVTKAMVKAYRAIQSHAIKEAFVAEMKEEFQVWGLRSDRPKGWSIVFEDKEAGGMCDVMEAA
jgi:hypothetical protein